MIKDAIVLFSTTVQSEERAYWLLWLKLLLAYTQELSRIFRTFLGMEFTLLYISQIKRIRSLTTDPKIFNSYQLTIAA